MPEITVTTTVAASPDAVWDRVASIEGVNHELGPWFRMTAPKGVDDIDPAAVPLGERWFRSWILFLGVLPVDYDDLTLVRIEPGRGFLERSKMLSQRVWEHERTLEPDGDGTRVTDRVRFEPRLRVGAGLQRALFNAIFRRRHRRLAAHFGGS